MALVALILFAGVAAATPASAAPAPAPNTVTAHGSAPDLGPPGTLEVTPLVGMAPTPSGNGYWLVASDGGVFTYGDAPFHGSAAHLPLVAPVVGMAATPSGNGYWLVAADGGVFSFGDAAFHGSAGALPLVEPVVGMAATPTGNGYWLVASDGGVFTYGDAGFHGSAGAWRLVAPVVGMAATSSGNGYWLAAADGGVFTFGDAEFHGSAAGRSDILTTAIEADPDGRGYWLLRGDGHVDEFAAADIGDAEVPGDDLWPLQPSVDLATTRSGGYWILHGRPLELRIGDQCGAVRCVEEHLEELGYWPGTVDKVFDDDTRQAVMAFQKVHDLTPDGVIDAELLTALDDASHADGLSTTGNVIEVDRDTGVVYLVKNGETEWALNAAVGASNTPTQLLSGRVLVAFDGSITDRTGDVGHRPLFIRPEGWSIHGSDVPLDQGATSDGDVIVSRNGIDLIWTEGLASTSVSVWIHG